MQQQIKGKRGAPVSPIWGLFSDKPDVQMRTGPDHALCRHCHQDVRHHHKVVSVESHLRRCAPFIALMTETNPDERPEWWSHAKKKVKKVIQPVPTTLLNASALRTSIPDRKTEINGTHSTKSKRGAPVSPTWALFSDIPAVHSQSAPSHATCRHCHEEVRHHHKVSSVETHLRRCKPFIELVNQIDEEERPEWWTNPIKKVKRSKLMIESTPSSPPVVTKAKRSDLSAMAKGPSITKPVQPPTVLPTVSRLQQSTFQKKMAMHYYVTNSSFQRMEDGYLHEALELCRPGMILPTTEQLCHELLDLCFHETTSEVYSVLDKSDQLWCLLAINVTNTTSSSDSSGRMHYMAVSPQKTVLIASTEQAEEVMRVLDRLDNCVWSGMVTNDPALRRLWKRKYPGKFVHGCASSGLHKLASAVFTHTDTTSSPLEPLADFVDDCKEVVSCFTNDRTMMSKLKSAQIKANAPVHGLTTPQRMPIKWTSVRMMFESLLDSYTYLLEMVEDSSFLIDVMGRHRKDQREQVKTIIQSDTFVPLLKKAIAIVSPLDKCMAMLESGAVATFVSDVFQTFGTLSSTFEAMEVLSKEEKDSLVSLLAAEREETCDDDHSIGNLLDPRFLGDGMSDEEREKHEKMIFEFPIDDETSEELTNLLKTEYQAFRTVALEDRQSKASIYQMLDKGKITPFQYWQNKVNTWPTLACIGLRVFTMVTSTTVSQQTCATYGHINSKNTDLLTTEQLYKLVYIKYNTIQRQEESNGLEHSSTDEETEDEMEN